MIPQISKSLRHRLVLPLPGIEAQLRMAHAERKLYLARYKVPDECNRGAVLILLYNDGDKVKIPLIVRQEYEGVHSGQISLPGGRIDKEDESLKHTALREAQEEIGIFKNDVEILGNLSELYIPPSNFLIVPYVGAMSYKPTFIPHDREVKSVIELDLDRLLDESIIREKEMELSNGMRIITPYFDFNGSIVWGATAMILSELKSVLFEIGY